MLLYRQNKQGFADQTKKIKSDVLKRIKKMADDQKDNNQKRAILSKMEKNFSMIKRNKQNELSCPTLMPKKNVTIGDPLSRPAISDQSPSQLRGKMNEFFKSKGLIHHTRISNEHHLLSIHQTYFGKEANFFFCSF